MNQNTSKRKAKPEGSQPFSVRLPLSLKARIQAASDKRGITSNALIVDALLAHFPPRRAK